MHWPSGSTLRIVCAAHHWWGSRPTRWALATDVALAALCAYAGGLLAVELTAGLPPVEAAPAVAVAVAHGASVALRRMAPRVMLGLLVTTALVYAGVGLPVAFLGPAALVAVYSVAAEQSRRFGLITWLGVELVLAALLLLGPGNGDLDSLVLYALLLAGAWFLGDVARRWRFLAQENGRRAAELEQARTELATQAVALERVRIARELHDVVAHSMSVVAMHAGAGRLAVGRDPVAATSALVVIERTTREALAEMRRLVAVLRDDAAGDGSAQSAPAPGLSDLPGLVAGMAATGLIVDVRTEGDVASVPPGVSLTAHRVVQEALTNVARHVGPTRVHVAVSTGPGALDLVVANEPGSGRPAPVPDKGGHGLRGMRERVELYGGQLEAGPTASGGWSVAVHLPSADAA